jgi:hypothetical protein
VESLTTLRVIAPKEGRPWVTGAGGIKVDLGETGGNHQEGLNGGQVATEKQIGRVVNSREMSDGRLRWADFGSYTKALSKTKEGPLALSA